MYKIFDFDVKGDDRGGLIALEQNIDIPFKINRVYYIFDTGKDVERGFHAHKNLDQVLIAINGSCEVVMDNGTYKEVVTLDSRNKGLLVESMVWHEMRGFSPDCVLLALASDYYKESDYIRNYEDFIKIV